MTSSETEKEKDKDKDIDISFDPIQFKNQRVAPGARSKTSVAAKSKSGPPIAKRTKTVQVVIRETVGKLGEPVNISIRVTGKITEATRRSLVERIANAAWAPEIQVVREKGDAAGSEKTKATQARGKKGSPAGEPLRGRPTRGVKVNEGTFKGVRKVKTETKIIAANPIKKWDVKVERSASVPPKGKAKK